MPTKLQADALSCLAVRKNPDSGLGNEQDQPTQLAGHWLKAPGAESEPATSGIA